MHISPSEAEEALAAIDAVMQKTRKSIASSGAYKFLILWGIIWMVGFLSNHFLPEDTASKIWIGLDIAGLVLSGVIGARLNRNVRSASATTTGKRIGWFWLLLFLYCSAVIGVAWPVDTKQLAMFIILIVSIGWMAMGLLLSFASIWWGLALTVTSLIGYFLLPDFFYLWMAFLGGGGMIALGFTIRKRW
jgi:hypothetical protein